MKAKTTKTTKAAKGTDRADLTDLTDRAEATPPVPPVVEMVATELVDVSPFQRRKVFPEAAAVEMAESVRLNGVMSPLMVRVVTPGRYELVAGERRLRGARDAGLAEVPVIVRVLTDDQAEELGLIENLQRLDLSPIEEAEGYAALKRLLDGDGRALYSDERIAERLCVPLQRVRMMLKLPGVPVTLLEALERKEVGLSTVALVGRVPDAASREKLADAILNPPHQEVPLGRDQVRDLIHEKYMIKLSKKDFDLDDKRLVPERVEDGVRLLGGACADCPMRSGNSVPEEDLAAGGTLEGRGKKGGKKGGVDPDLCTNPGCHRLKLDAMWKRRKVEATEQGRPTMEGKDAKALFGSWGGLTHNSPLVALDEAPNYEDFRKWEMPAWRNLLKGTDVVTTLVRHPDTGRAMELVDRKKAIEAVKAKDKAAGPDGEKSTGPSAAEVSRRREEKAAQRLAVLEGVEAVEACGNAVTARVRSLEMVDGYMGPLELLFRQALDNGGADGAYWMGKYLGVTVQKGGGGRDYFEPVCAKVAELASADGAKWLGFTLMALLARSAKWQGMNASDVQEAMAALGVDGKEIAARAKALLDAERPVKKKKERGSSEDRGAEAGERTGSDEVAEIARLEINLETTRLGTRVNGYHAREEVDGFDDWDEVVVIEGGLTVCLAEWPEGWVGQYSWGGPLDRLGVDDTDGADAVVSREMALLTELDCARLDVRVYDLKLSAAEEEALDRACRAAEALVEGTELEEAN